MASERTEAATPRRLADIRRRGQTARSAEVNAAVTLLVGVVALQSFGATTVTALQGLLRATFEHPVLPGWSPPAVHSYAIGVTLQALGILAPFFGVLLAVALASNFIQVGALFTLEPLAPKLSRINPMEGFRRLLSTRGLIELLKACLKIGVIGAVMLQGLSGQRDEVLALVRLQVADGAAMGWRLVSDLLLRAAVALIAVAAIDYLYQRWEFVRNARMSRDEVREELRSTEGSPELRAWLRQRARTLASGRMVQAVPTADVVLTNPTHLAVALRYEPGKMAAPKVVAKGQRLLAERIKQLARDAGVQILENKPLAQALYRAASVGDEIPAPLYEAVAEVLAFVYRIKTPSAGRI